MLTRQFPRLSSRHPPLSKKIVGGGRPALFATSMGKVTDPLSTDPLSTVFGNACGKLFIWFSIEISINPSVRQGVPMFVTSKMFLFYKFIVLMKNRSICLSHKLHF